MDAVAQAPDRSRSSRIQKALSLLTFVLVAVVVVGLVLLAVLTRAYARSHVLTAEPQGSFQASVHGGDTLVLGVSELGYRQSWASSTGLTVQFSGLRAVRLVAPKAKDWDSSHNGSERQRDFGSFAVGGAFTVPTRPSAQGPLLGVVSGKVTTDQGFGHTETDDVHIPIRLTVAPGAASSGLGAHGGLPATVWLLFGLVALILAITIADLAFAVRGARRSRRDPIRWRHVTNGLIVFVVGSLLFALAWFFAVEPSRDLPDVGVGLPLLPPSLMAAVGLALATGIATTIRDRTPDRTARARQTAADAARMAARIAEARERASAQSAEQAYAEFERLKSAASSPQARQRRPGRRHSGRRDREMPLRRHGWVTLFHSRSFQWRRVR